MKKIFKRNSNFHELIEYTYIVLNIQTKKFIDILIDLSTSKLKT